MTRFDAPTYSGGRAASASGSVRSTLAGHPSIFIVSVLLAGLSICVACGLLFVGQGARYRLERTIDAVQLAVFLQPHVSRADAEGLRGRIEACPHIAGAALRKREDALTALTGSGLESLAIKPNPLPDVWLVTLGLTKVDTAQHALSSQVAESTSALAALPGVESVRADSRWIETLDRWWSWIGRGLRGAVWMTSAALIGSLLGLFFLAGRGYALSASDRSITVQALATIGMVGGLTSVIVSTGMIALLSRFVPDFGAAWSPTIDAIGRDGHFYIVAMGVAIIAVSAIGTISGGSRR